MEVGHELIVITWLHEAKRDVLKGHPRNDESPVDGRVLYALTCTTNPLGLHPVTVGAIEGTLKGRADRSLRRNARGGYQSASTRAEG